MKKSPKKLKLSRETLHHLDEMRLRGAVYQEKHPFTEPCTSIDRTVCCSYDCPATWYC